jgi:hypothetical protein
MTPILKVGSPGVGAPAPVPEGGVGSGERFSGVLVYAVHERLLRTKTGFYGSAESRCCN